jgi:catechol 2,3-dioxygenase
MLVDGRNKGKVGSTAPRAISQSQPARAASFMTEQRSARSILKIMPFCRVPAKPVDPAVRIGHVHLKVSDLDRALDFYCGVLGFELQQRYGTEAAFVSAGGYHHHIGLNTWESKGAGPPPPQATGLYHFAILYPTRAGLADALRRLRDAGIALDGATDHGVSEALYLRDPDDNGIELYCDRPRDQWPRTGDGTIEMFTRPLDLEALLATV